MTPLFAEISHDKMFWSIFSHDDYRTPFQTGEGIFPLEQFDSIPVIDYSTVHVYTVFDSIVWFDDNYIKGDNTLNKYLEHANELGIKIHNWQEDLF